MGAALLLAVASLRPSAALSQAAPLHRGHAHNDYRHERPLREALALGYTSIEVDVHLRDGELWVAHDAEEIRPGWTLERLYLEPLRQHVRGNGGRVFADGTPLLLLIDVKTEAEESYRALHRTLRGYADLLTRFEQGEPVPGPVLAVVSGERAAETMRGAPLRFAALDGRLPDLDAGDLPPTLMPLVSESWKKVTTWTGEGPAPPGLGAELRRLSRLARSQGRRLRFWGTPDQEAVWRLLAETGVDLINTDDLVGLRAFLERQQ